MCVGGKKGLCVWKGRGGGEGVTSEAMTFRLVAKGQMQKESSFLLTLDAIMQYTISRKKTLILPNVT